MTENKKPTQPPQPPQTMKCFIVPVDGMEQLRDVIREAPHKSAQPALNYLATLQVADVPVQMQQKPV